MADTHIKIHAVSPRIQYVGNGTTKTFPYQFPIFNRENINVYLGETKQETGYTVSGAGNTDGGYVTFTVAPAEGVIVTLIRNIDIERVTDFQEGGAFRPKNINDELDRLTVFCQQNEEAINRAVKLPPTSQQESPDYLIDQIIQYRDEAVQSASSAFASSESASSSASNAESSATTASESAEECRELVDGVRSILSVAQLLEHKWFDHLVNDMAWLRADTFSWQSGQIYSTVYQHLVADLSDATAGSEEIAGITIEYYTATDGHKIVLPSQETAVEQIYQATGVAWYYIVDTTNQRFKLPRIDSTREGLLQKAIVKSSNYAPTFRFNSKPSYSSSGWTINSSGSSLIASGNGQPGYELVGGIEADFSEAESIYKGHKYLYFYVGEYSRSAVEQTAGLNSELFNQKADADLSNINASAVAKEMIVGWGMPDYSAGVSKSSGVEYTAEVSGYIMAQCFHNSTSGTTHITCVINGVTIPFSPGAADYGRSQIYLHIKKGDIYKITANSGIYFFPNRG